MAFHRFAMGILLMGGSALGVTVNYQPCDFSVPEAVASGDIQLAKKAQSIFEASCKSCHGKGETGGANVMDDIMDREALIRDGMIDLADPPNSKIMKAINRPSRWMPLGGAQLPDSDKAALLAWIQGGAVNWDEGQTEEDPILTHRQERACIRWDQGKWSEKHPEKDLYYIRYLTLGHLKGKDFVTARDGAIKMVQLLSRSGGGPKPAQRVDKLGKILRIDLRDYEPTFDFKAWENYVIPGYPYAYVSAVDKIQNQYTDDINRHAYSEWAFVRADFFVARVSENKTYMAILKMPDTLQEFELKQLSVDADKDLVYGDAKRGSVAKSGVTHNPRLVDWFPVDIYAHGSFVKAAHWITRDFNSDKARSNIYAFPAGPATLNKYHGWTEDQFFQDKVFQHQAGESITGKADGFDIYGIWDAQGKNVDEADPKIAIDRSGLYDDNVVRNPLSCIMCHSGGPNPFDDDTVINHIKGSPAFSVVEVDFFDYLFFKPDQRTKAFSNHAKSFKDAMNALGLTDPKYLTPGGEPTSNTFRKFQAWITCTDLAWELGIPVAKLESVLHHSPDLARQLGMGDCRTGKLSRANYVHLFPKIVSDFNIGYAVKIKGGASGHVDPYVPPTNCKNTITNRSGYTVKFQAVYGAVSERVQINHGVSKSWDVANTVKGTISDSWTWNGRHWVTFREAWTAEPCRNYAFKWSGGRAQLFRD